MSILGIVGGVVSLVNKIADRAKEMRITRAIKRDITNRAKEKIADAKKKVKKKLRKSGYFPDDTDP